MPANRTKAERRAERFKTLFIILFCVAAVHSAFNAVSAMLSKTGSLPWPSAFLITTLFYLPFLIAVGFAFVFTKRRVRIARKAVDPLTPEAVFARYQKQNPEAKTYVSYAFCGGGPDADELLALVLAGVKRGTASSVDVYEVEGEAIPKVGDLAVILDSQGSARCIVETTAVEILPFIDVPERFAQTEGEGDQSLAYWREAHERFFTREMESIGKTFSPDMCVIMETFALVYRADGLPLPKDTN